MNQNELNEPKLTKINEIFLSQLKFFTHNQNFFSHN